MAAQRYHKFMPIWLLLGISAAGAPTITQAEVHIEGTAAAVHVTTDRDAIPDVLSAFETPFNLRCLSVAKAQIVRWNRDF